MSAHDKPVKSLSRVFIERPRLDAVVAIVMAFAGILALPHLAMEEFGFRDSHFEESGEIISRATILKSIGKAHAHAYRIVADGVVAGGIVLILDEARREGVLDLLFVAPTMHSRGIGQGAWRKVEEMHPQIKRWITYTPYFEKRNIHFYVNRLGFKIVAYYHEKFPDPAHPSAADGMLKFEKTV